MVKATFSEDLKNPFFSSKGEEWRMKNF